MKKNIIIMPIYIKHIVSFRDSLASISKQYGVSINQIKKDNGLKNNQIFTNQALKIKVGEEKFKYS